MTTARATARGVGRKDAAGAFFVCTGPPALRDVPRCRYRHADARRPPVKHGSVFTGTQAWDGEHALHIDLALFDAAPIA
ncbi:hypothetical protein [Pseudoxanthomonas sp.]|uniref:hypothetical protein n=1 Tax=Pseudoxanthomonas sp. TaxID=1871049 RepID=UPI002632F27A|nr:hypothetical protein [Pseudoxanthomonas sp.]WDS35507.1 MAG: hypothetical protein O8I58_14325 [Pseudoxanthomonas sp.]